MNSTDRELKDLIDRHLKWPSDLAFIAARDRVREELLSTPAHLQKARIAERPGDRRVAPGGGRGGRGRHGGWRRDRLAAWA